MKLGDLKSMAEDLSFQYHLVSRQVSVRGAGFRVYAWHPRLWRFPDVPPTSWLLDSVGPQSVVYDVGANRGYVALSLLAKQPGLRVVAFEPNPGVLGKLLGNLDLNGFTDRVSVLGIGLGEQLARAPLFLAASDSASSLDGHHAEYWGNGILTSIEVEIMTLDALLAKGDLPPPTHIKVDTEGFEAQILRGAQETLRTYRPELFVEIHAESQGMGDNYGAILSALAGHAYRVTRAGNQVHAVPEAA